VIPSSVRTIALVLGCATAHALQTSPVVAGQFGQQSQSPLEIGSRLEMFVDDWLIDQIEGLRREQQTPIDAEQVFGFNQPWEGRWCNYVHIFKDGDKWRMYYRGARAEFEIGEPGSSNICLAESTDGLNWTKPSLGIYEFAGTRDNNVTYIGDGTPNWYCFKDDNPDEPPQRRYKAICKLSLGFGGPLGVMQSADGIHWKWWKKEPVISGGPLDTLHVARWDPQNKRYLAYVRNWVTRSKGFRVPPEIDAPPSEYNTWYKLGKERVRAIALCTSTDFLNWSRQQWLVYDENLPIEHHYTNAVTPYFRAPHIYVGFPMRYVPERSVVAGWTKTEYPRSVGCSDSVFMSSRDGLHWDRGVAAFLRPGLDQQNWTDRNMMIAPGVVPTGPGEMSLFYVAHYGHPDCHLRRVRLRLDGFYAVTAGYPGGEFVTKPLIFSGRQLVINYSTSAVGDIRVEIQDAKGKPVPGHTLGEANEIVGDRIEQTVSWKGGSDVSALAGTPIRLRFVMRDADLFSLRFVTPRHAGQSSRDP